MRPPRKISEQRPKLSFLINVKWGKPPSSIEKRMTGGERELSVYDLAAEEGIKKILEMEGVAFRNELRYRLEKPDRYQLGVRFLLFNAIDSAIIRLQENGIIQPTDNRGRKRLSNGGWKPYKFFRLTKASYSRHLQEMIRRKKDCAIFIRGISSYAGFRAQQLWLTAFRKLDYNILREDVNCFDGNKASVAGNIDFIAEKDGFHFGVEVKNGFAYPQIANKFKIAVELNTIPFIVARMLSWNDRQKIPYYGGFYKIYETSIYTSECPKKIHECMELLSYPMIIRDEIDEDVVMALDHILNLARNGEEETHRRLAKYKALNSLN